jgi:NAD(P)-dependent dehydrogenase (short-subunit alcohol dehydrogenase family)
MNRLDGKIAFISGAARGIGAATAQLMVDASAKVGIGECVGRAWPDDRARDCRRQRRRHLTASRCDPRGGGMPGVFGVTMES